VGTRFTQERPRQCKALSKPTYPRVINRLDYASKTGALSTAGRGLGMAEAGCAAQRDRDPILGGRWREWASIKAPEERGGKTRVRQTYCGLSCRAGERAGLFRCGTSRGLRCLFHMSGAQ
jgi:hypothetical protein